MATTIDFIQYVVQQMQSDNHLRYIRMMGEYCIYYDDKVIALVTDNQLFLKDTPSGRLLLSEITLQEAYPGSKQFLLVDRIDDHQLLSSLAAATYHALPPAKVKKPKVPKSK